MMKASYGGCFRYTAAVLTVCVLFLSGFPDLGPAAELTLGWNANADPAVVGYKLYYGKASRTYDMAVDVGKVTRYTLTGIEEGKTFYFAVTAYDAKRNESAFSTELTCFSLLPSSGANGSISPSNTKFVSLGMSQTFRIIPEDNYFISSVWLDMVSVGPVESYTFSNVDRNHGISASFSATRSSYGSFSSFNGDGKPDLLFRNTLTGEVYVLYLNGVTYSGGASMFTVADQSWSIAGTGDFNSDGNADILWRNISTGENCILYMSGASYTGLEFLPPVADQNWSIAGTDDFDSDGNPDILWRNISTGENVLWYMSGITVTGWNSLSSVSDPNWAIVGTGDFNSDSIRDILWRNLSTGENYVCYMNGVTCTSGAYLPAVADLNWTIIGTGDFNSDGNLDILWRNLLTGENYVWFMKGVTCTDVAVLFKISDLNWMIF